MTRSLQKIIHTPISALASASQKQLIAILMFTALLAGLSTLNRGLQSDDYLHRYMLTDEKSSFIEQINGFFNFLGASESLPWWTHPQLKIHFWRPLSALSHWLDYQLWPDTPMLMHAQSALWYLALVGLCFLFFKRLFKNEALAFFAAFLFCIDFSHFANISWIANRNSLIASVFIVSCLIFYLDWRSSQKISRLFFSMGAFILALLSAESSASVLIIIYAYEFIYWKDKKLESNKSHFLALLIFSIITFLWLFFYQNMGFGSANNSMYFSPFTNITYNLQLISSKLPVFLFGNLLGIEGFYNIFSPLLKFFISIVCFLFVLIFLINTKKLLNDKSFQFLLLASIFPLIPVSLVAVLDMRLGIYSSIFSAGLLALIFQELYSPIESKKIKSLLLIFLLSSHLLVATFQWLSVGVRDWQHSPNSFLKLEDISKSYSNKNIFIFNYPSPIDAYYFPFSQKNNTNNIYVLNNNLANFQLNIPSMHSIILNAEQGLVFISSDLDKMQNLPLMSGIYARAAFNGMLPRDFIFSKDDIFSKSAYSVKVLNLNESKLIRSLEFNFHSTHKENLFFLWNTHTRSFEEINKANLLENKTSLSIINI